MPIKSQIWDQLKAAFMTGVPATEPKGWLSRSSLKEITPQQAVIEAPNKFIADWLRDTYGRQIEAFFREKLNPAPQLFFTHADSRGSAEMESADPLTHQPTVFYLHGIDTRTTFADFVTANSNRFAYSSALQVAENPATAYNPFFIYSAPGLGKTHLLNGIGNHVLGRNPDANIIYLPADQLAALLSYAGDPPIARSQRFWEEDGAPDFLLIDDIHLLASQQRFQTELLALCRSYIESSRQLVVAAASPPGRIRNLLPQLCSRLRSGLIAEIHAPGQRTKLRIVKRAAKKEHLTLSDDVAFFLATTTNNVSTLLHHMALLGRHVSIHNRPLDLSTAESLIKSVYPPHVIDIHHIQSITAHYFKISIADLLSDKRGRAFSYPRQVAIYLSKQLTDLSLKDIGRAFGNKHHSTVIYAQKRIQEDKRRNDNISKDIDNIIKLLFC